MYLDRVVVKLVLQGVWGLGVEVMGEICNPRPKFTLDVRDLMGLPGFLE